MAVTLKKASDKQREVLVALTPARIVTVTKVTKDDRVTVKAMIETRKGGKVIEDVKPTVGTVNALIKVGWLKEIGSMAVALSATEGSEITKYEITDEGKAARKIK